MAQNGGEFVKRALVYGFLSFGDVRVNPSAVLIERLRASRRAERLLLRSFEVSYEAVARELDALFASDGSIAAAIGFGVAAGEHAVRLERVARNAVGAKADARGANAEGAAVVAGGRSEYQTGYDAARLCETLVGADIPARVSDDAGGYLCNFAYYLTARHLTARGAPDAPPALFAHLPLQPSEAARLGSKSPSMAIDLMESAANLILDAVLD